MHILSGFFLVVFLSITLLNQSIEWQIAVECVIFWIIMWLVLQTFLYYYFKDVKYHLHEDSIELKKANQTKKTWPFSEYLFVLIGSKIYAKNIQTGRLDQLYYIGKKHKAFKTIQEWLEQKGLLKHEL